MTKRKPAPTLKEVEQHARRIMRALLPTLYGTMYQPEITLAIMKGYADGYALGVKNMAHDFRRIAKGKGVKRGRKRGKSGHKKARLVYVSKS